jgi:hypothetical protein
VPSRRGRRPSKARRCLGTFRTTVAARSGLARQRWGAARIAGQPPAPLPCIVVLVANLRARPAKLFRIIEAYYMADNKMIKTVGEHRVCATLARHKWAPALTRDGLERTDILAVATHLENRPTIEIQVKTATEGTRLTSWPIGLKAQEIAKSAYEWFVLVLLPTLPAAPRAFVVPRDHVSAATWIAHQHWLTDPEAPAGRRNAELNQARIQLSVWERYEDRWDLLDMPTADVPVLLPSWLRERAQEKRVGLPPGHPWAEALPAWG